MSYKPYKQNGAACVPNVALPSILQTAIIFHHLSAIHILQHLHTILIVTIGTVIHCVCAKKAQ
jgi:hypothetical protein